MSTNNAAHTSSIYDNTTGVEKFRNEDGDWRYVVNCDADPESPIRARVSAIFQIEQEAIDFRRLLGQASAFTVAKAQGGAA